MNQLRELRNSFFGKNDYTNEPTYDVRPMTEQDKQIITNALEAMETEIANIKQILASQEIRTKKKRSRPIRNWFAYNMLLVTVMWQLILVVIVGLCELIFENEKAVLDVAITLGSLIQFVQMIFIIMTSIKLVKQLTHRTASGWFLIQSYLSVIILFAGIYTLIYQIKADSFHSEQLRVDTAESETIFAIYTVFLYFSGTTMTTVGYGDIYPGIWFTQFVVLFQELLSVVFSTVIFVKGLSHFGGKVTKKKEEKSSPEDIIAVPMTSYGTTEAFHTP